MGGNLKHDLSTRTYVKAPSNIRLNKRGRALLSLVRGKMIEDYQEAMNRQHRDVTKREMDFRPPWNAVIEYCLEGEGIRMGAVEAPKKLDGGEGPDPEKVVGVSKVELQQQVQEQEGDSE